MPTGFAVTAYLAPATTTVSATGVASAAVTLTIPSAGAGLYNYITELEISAYCTATIAAGAATPIAVTSTGITGTPTFKIAQPVGATGQVLDRLIYTFDPPLRGSAVATALTVVAPVYTNAIWNINAAFYTDV